MILHHLPRSRDNESCDTRIDFGGEGHYSTKSVLKDSRYPYNVFIGGIIDSDIGKNAIFMVRYRRTDPVSSTF